MGSSAPSAISIASGSLGISAATAASTSVAASDTVVDATSIAEASTAENGSDESVASASIGYAFATESKSIGASGDSSSIGVPRRSEITRRDSSVSSEYSRSVGSSRRSFRLKKSRNSFVVPYSIGRPTSSRFPRMRISARSINTLSVPDESTPRMSSISGRVMGWR